MSVLVGLFQEAIQRTILCNGIINKNYLYKIPISWWIRIITPKDSVTISSNYQMVNFRCKITSQAMMSTMAVIMQINNNSSVIKSKLKLMTMDHKDYFKNKTKRLCYSSLLRLLISSSAMYTRVL